MSAFIRGTASAANPARTTIAMLIAAKACGKPSTSPLRVVRSPATAVSVATPRAAPISCPVIIRPDASPDFSCGMPAIAATEIATNIGPVPRPRIAKPGSTSVQ